MSRVDAVAWLLAMDGVVGADALARAATVTVLPDGVVAEG